MIIKNTTIQNRSKQDKLSNSHNLPQQNNLSSIAIRFLQEMISLNLPKDLLIYSIGSKLLEKNRNPAVLEFLNSYEYDAVNIENIPHNEFDLLGSLYQFLNSKIENLEKGSFYTGEEIATDMVQDLDFSEGQRILDPSCGSGSFLFRSNAKAEQIYGIDLDPIAIMIAKFNYFLKFPDGPRPHLYAEDFFLWYSRNHDQQFDYIIGNPPYGANIDISRILMTRITSGESFSYFTEFCYKLLAQDGVFRFLLPESILNVKRHTDIRDLILDEADLIRIKKYSQKFTGVMSDVYLIELGTKKTKNMIFENGTKTVIPKKLFLEMKNHIFVHLNENDIRIIERVDSIKKYDLSKSIFGLGVVTGDNKSKFLSSKVEGAEQVFTGKEVEKYKLLPAKTFLVFDRTKLQQVAPDSIYRAPAKLVYKTISKQLKVAIDWTGSLTSNSANLIIPNGIELNIITISALLNSDLYSFLNKKLFGGVNKIAKENLMALPFPAISPEDELTIQSFYNEILEGAEDIKLQEFICKKIFGLSEIEIAYISECIDQQ